MRSMIIAWLLFVGLLSNASGQGGPDMLTTWGGFIGVRATFNPTITYRQTVYHPDFTQSVQEYEAEQGFGGGLWLGWAYRSWGAVYGGFDLASHGSDDVDAIRANYFEIGVRVSVPTGSRFVPYANVSYTNQGFTLDRVEGSGNVIIVGDELTSDVPASTWGVGFQFGILDVSYQRTRLTFREEDNPLTGPMDSSRIAVGSTIWFGPSAGR